MQLQRCPLLLVLPLVISLSACIAFPTDLPDEDPFKVEKFAFIEIGKTTKEEIATAMSDFPIKTDEGEVRVKLTPQKYRGGDWWLYAQTRKELKWVLILGLEAGEFGGNVDYRFLLIKFDNNGIVAGYEKSSSEGSGCNRRGVCALESLYTLLASEDEDRIVKQFDIPADRCGVYVYGTGSIWLDGQRVGSLLSTKQFFFRQLDQGVHQLAFRSPDADQRPIEISCAAGDLYFFALKGKSSGSFASSFHSWIEIEQPDAVTGRKAIGKRQLTLNITEPSELSSLDRYLCKRRGVCALERFYMLLASEDKDRVVKQFDIPADRCGVYVYGNPMSAVPIWLDGHRIDLLLSTKQFFFRQLDQGVHQLAPTLSPDVPDQVPMEFSCAGGDLYFFEVKRKSSGFFRKRYWIEIEQPDAVTGRKAIGKRQLTRNIAEPSD